MPQLNVDRLTLKVSGVSERDGRRLAVLVAEAISAGDPAAPFVLLGAIRVNLERRSGEGLDALAQRVAAGVLSRLRRSL
jgi:hypothetical protein